MPLACTEGQVGHVLPRGRSVVPCSQPCFFSACVVRVWGLLCPPVGSLFVLLLRLVPASHGSIMIDGVDTSTVGVVTLRKRVSIIPQDVSAFVQLLVPM